jgi:hypothetical protein
MICRMHAVNISSWSGRSSRRSGVIQSMGADFFRIPANDIMSAHLGEGWSRVTYTHMYNPMTNQDLVIGEAQSYPSYQLVRLSIM